jgi:hypothetical protein
MILQEVAAQASNTALGLDAPSTQQAYAQQVADYINAHGGVACRKLAVQFYTGDVADSTQLEQLCQQIIASKPFAVMDIGAYGLSPLYSCFLQAQLPFFGIPGVSLSLVHQYEPYLFPLGGVLDDFYTNGVLAMKQAGFFDPAHGFKAPLGVLYEDCFPQVVQKFFAELHSVGISDSEMSTYNWGCPSLFASPSDIEQAILQFKRAGVTLVTMADEAEASWSTFTKAAQQQTFHPTYAMGTENIEAASTGALAPDSNNANGAIAFLTNRAGEENTPGVTPSPATQRCNAILAAKGSPPVYKQGEGDGGKPCDYFWALQAGLANAPSLSRSALAVGLMRLGSLELSYPLADANFSGLSFPYGGEYFHTIQYHGACSCWQEISPFKPLLVKP